MRCIRGRWRHGTSYRPKPGAPIKTSLTRGVKNDQLGYWVRWRDRSTGQRELQWFADEDEARVFKVCVSHGLSIDEAHQAVWRLVQES